MYIIDKLGIQPMGKSVIQSLTQVAMRMRKEFLINLRNNALKPTYDYDNVSVLCFAVICFYLPANIDCFYHNLYVSLLPF